MTSWCRCRSTNWTMPSTRFCIFRNASSCGCSCVTITAPATSPHSSTCRGTATPRPACLRLEQILRDAFDADRVEYTTLVSDSVLARLHFVVRRADAAPLAEADHEELERRLADAIRSWSDDLADTLRSEDGR